MLIRIIGFGFNIFVCALFSASASAAVIEKERFWEDKLNLTLLAKDVSVRGRVADIFSVNTGFCNLECIRDYLIRMGRNPYHHANMMTWQDKSRIVTLVVKSGKGLTNGYLIESSVDIPRRDLDFPLGKMPGAEKIIDVGSKDDGSINHTWVVMIRARSDFSGMVRRARVQGYKETFAKDGELTIMDKGSDHIVMSMVEARGSISVLINLTRGEIR